MVKIARDAQALVVRVTRSEVLRWLTRARSRRSTPAGSFPGMNRWVLRTAVWGGLMTSRRPPLSPRPGRHLTPAPGRYPHVM